MLALAGCGGTDAREQGATAGSVTTEEATPEPAAGQATADRLQDRGAPEPDHAGVVREPLPVSVEIPAIGVDAELVGLGLNDDGSMELPDFGLAGWYVKGPPPGAAGPAVIAAHVDSTDGPDVFYELRSLQPGDEIHVDREDGSTASFVVEDVEQHPKDELPGDRIWAASSQPRLTLITCGGAFDRTIGHYTDNVIAYAAAA